MPEWSLAAGPSMRIVSPAPRPQRDNGMIKLPIQHRAKAQSDMYQTTSFLFVFASNTNLISKTPTLIKDPYSRQSVKGGGRTLTSLACLLFARHSTTVGRHITHNKSQVCEDKSDSQQEILTN